MSVELVELVSVDSFWHLNVKKGSKPSTFSLLTSKCASRHNGVHFFSIWTSKSGPTPSVSFFTFDLKMYFVPRWRAFFSTSELPKVVRRWCVVCILTWKSASRHNGVQFFISHLASWLRTRSFSKPTFRPSRATNHWTKERIATFLPVRAPASSFFSLFLFSDLLTSSPLWLFSPLLFHLSILLEVWLLNFLRSCVSCYILTIL